MATLAAIRTALNREVGVAIVDDATDLVFPLVDRNAAISDAYADLYVQGAMKPLVQSFSTVTDQFVYALTAIRRLARCEVLDSSSRILEHPKGQVRDDGTGGFELVLIAGIASGYTMKVRGWGPYISVFANDAAVDDLPAEYGRVPRLKAKLILYEAQFATFLRYASRQAAPPLMQVSAAELAGMIAAVRAEYADAVKKLQGTRPRVGQTLSLG